jgi:hypothetical protein
VAILELGQALEVWCIGGAGDGDVKIAQHSRTMLEGQTWRSHA